MSIIKRVIALVMCYKESVICIPLFITEFAGSVKLSPCKSYSFQLHSFSWVFLSTNPGQIFIYISSFKFFLPECNFEIKRQLFPAKGGCSGVHKSGCVVFATGANVCWLSTSYVWRIPLLSIWPLTSQSNHCLYVSLWTSTCTRPVSCIVND